jgi:hypothetical protein
MLFLGSQIQRTEYWLKTLEEGHCLEDLCVRLVNNIKMYLTEIQLEVC